jgi:hypothetical protein
MHIIEGFKMLKRIIFLLLLSCLIGSVAAPVFAVSWKMQETSEAVCLETSLVKDTLLDELDLDSSTPATTASINIRNIRSGEYVYSNVLIIAQVTGIFSKVYYTIDLVTTRYAMTRVGTTNRYQAVWNTATLSAGSHTLYVKAYNSIGSLVGSASVKVTVVKAYRYALYFEIDYMSGHSPPASVRTYMQNYWKGFAIQVTFKIDDIVTDPTPNDGKITDTDFWAIENANNDVWKYDDRAHGSSANGKYTLKEKWMLYGTWAPSSSTGGYTYITRSGSDVLGGNYIFIADSMIDNWEATNSILYDGGEEMVVCHEAGHSIGICKLSATYTEVYDSDYYSIMSSMRTQNAKSMAHYWYYSKEYWATANLSYYGI